MDKIVIISNRSKPEVAGIASYFKIFVLLDGQRWPEAVMPEAVMPEAVMYS